jgi:hypothetical protein
MITAGNVIGLIGWCFLLASWIVPYVMMERGKDSSDRSLVGMILSAIACGFFVSQLIVAWIS